MYACMYTVYVCLCIYLYIYIYISTPPIRTVRLGLQGDTVRNHCGPRVSLVLTSGPAVDSPTFEDFNRTRASHINPKTRSPNP